jgi:uncharacterized protein YdaU (DUF1376 family)
MSQLDWFPFYYAEFYADTIRLPTKYMGAYFLLLLDYYQHCEGCLADDEVIGAVTGLRDPNEWPRLKQLVMPYFEVRDGHLWHARCEKEIAKAREIMAKTKASREQQSEAGRASAAKRWGNRKERSNGRYNDQDNDLDNDRFNERDAYNNSNKDKKEEGPLRGPEKKAPDGAPRVLAHPMPSDFSLKPEDLIRCQIDGADPPWVWSVFNDWKAACLTNGTLTTDWKAAWWRRWDKSKPPEPVEPDKPKPRVVVSKSARSVKTLLPADWQPNANNARAAEEEGYDLDKIADHFRNVCGANGYRYVDHHLAFTNFIHNQKNFERGRNHGQASRRGSIVEAGDRAIANLDRKIREAEADEARDRDGDQSVPGLPED